MVNPEIKLSELRWEFRRKGEDKWHTASVPGCVHTDLFRNDLIPDPFFSLNEKEIQWIEKHDWEYRAVFNTAPEHADYGLILSFDGLDTYAEIYFNDEPVLSACNMFIPWQCRIPASDVRTENTIKVVFLSPYSEGLKHYKKLDYRLPANNDEGEKRVSPFTRKAPYMYGWDWGPRFLTSGIWKDGRIITAREAFISGLYIDISLPTSSQAQLSIIPELENLIPGENYRLLFFIDGKEIGSTSFMANKEFAEPEFKHVIENPELWWPRGYGKQKLYLATVSLEKDGKITGEKEKHFGVRTSQLIREPDEKGNPGFIIRINGRDIFMKGANIIPSEFFVSEIRQSHYDRIIDDAVSVNMNMLRCWGGGIYEDDYFYERCSREGLMIWQDFMFACGMYPSDDEFLDNISNEINWQSRRLNHQPSLVLWCGNNEILEGYHFWGWKEELGEAHNTAFESYARVFYSLIPGILSKNSPSVPYWPSSPSADYDRAPEPGSGDYHYWDIVKDIKPYTVYAENTGRFMSEFGFKSYPEISSISKFLEEPFDVHSAEMEEHQGWPTGLELVEKNIKWFYPEPKNFEHFIYMSQLLQADAISYAIEAHRRAKPFCMGSLYWQMNDCWPSASWSGIDYYGNWKALHYRLKESFSDLLISCTFDENILSLYTISDRLCKPDAVLILKLLDFSGNLIRKEETALNIVADSSKKQIELNVPVFSGDREMEECFFKFEILNNSKLIASRLFFPARPADLKLKKPSLSFEYDIVNGQKILLVSTDTLVKNLFLADVKSKVYFSDNYFDVIPGEKKPVICRSDEITDFRDLVYLSLNDCI